MLILLCHTKKKNKQKENKETIITSWKTVDLNLFKVLQTLKNAQEKDS